MAPPVKSKSPRAVPLFLKNPNFGQKLRSHVFFVKKYVPEMKFSRKTLVVWYHVYCWEKSQIQPLSVYAFAELFSYVKKLFLRYCLSSREVSRVGGGWGEVDVPMH